MESTQGALPDRYATWPLVRRLLFEQALPHWRGYAAAFALMAIAAAATGLTPYLTGDVVNLAYRDRDLRTIVLLCAAVFVVFVVKGLATYGQTVLLARLGK